MIHSQYYVEQEKLEKLQERKNRKSDFYNGIFDRYEDPVLTRDHIPVIWKYDIDADTNPYFMERLGVNAVMNSGAIELNGKYYLVARVEGADRKSFLQWQKARQESMDLNSGIILLSFRIPVRRRPMYMTCA